MFVMRNKADFLNYVQGSHRSDQFSAWAWSEIFDYYENFETPIELDVIAFCCEFAEVDNYDVQELENYKNCEIVAEGRDSTLFLQG